MYHTIDFLSAIHAAESTTEENSLLVNNTGLPVPALVGIYVGIFIVVAVITTIIVRNIRKKK